LNDLIEEEQSIIAKMMIFVDSHDPTEFLGMIKMFEEYFMNSCIERKKFVCPALLSRYNVLIHRISKLKSLNQPQTVQETETEQPNEEEEKTGENEQIEGEVKEPQPEKETKDLIEEYAKEHYNFLDNAGYLTEEERENFSFKAPGIDRLNLITLVHSSKAIIDDFAQEYPEMAISSGLSLATTLSVCDTQKVGDEVQYNICSDILERFEDEIYESKGKIYHLENIINSFYYINNMTNENMDIIVRNTKTFASSMLRKSDSCL